MQKSILNIVLLFSIFTQAQNGFEDWDKNYKYKNAEEIIKTEIEYAHEVEKDTTQGHYYVTLQKFRFTAKYTGKERPISKETLNSMRRVLKVRMGNDEFLNGLVSKEFEFDIGKSKIWMPIQNQLITPLKKESKKGQEVLLYTLFTNEHKYNGGIINTFLISEFTTEWN